jgi:hypothetical protein
MIRQPIDEHHKYPQTFKGVTMMTRRQANAGILASAALAAAPVKVRKIFGLYLEHRCVRPSTR